MKSIPPSYWNTLAARYEAALVSRYQVRLDSCEAFLERQPTDAPARALLEELEKAGFLEVQAREVCPNCQTLVDDLAASEKRCSRCSASFEHDGPLPERVYFRRGRRSRDPRWVVTVHGMNTYGPWQEEFGWQLAQIYGYSLPVAVFKYGRILISPLLLLGQERYAQRLADRLRRISQEMKDGGFGDRPDVVAHSFGTWLFARALDLAPELCFGRVVLTGSIVPPDFDWGRFLGGDSPRVEAILCHYGGRDSVVPLAQFFIPGSGPSGRRGFNGAGEPGHRLRQWFAPTFGHSSYFADANLRSVMTTVWGPFLTLPDDRLDTWGEEPGPRTRRDWRRSRLGPLSQAFKYATLALLALLLVTSAAAFLAGAWELVNLLAARSTGA